MRTKAPIVSGTRIVSSIIAGAVFGGLLAWTLFYEFIPNNLIFTVCFWLGIPAAIIAGGTVNGILKRKRVRMTSSWLWWANGLFVLIAVTQFNADHSPTVANLKEHYRSHRQEFKAAEADLPHTLVGPRLDPKITIPITQLCKSAHLTPSIWEDMADFGYYESKRRITIMGYVCTEGDPTKTELASESLCEFYRLEGNWYVYSGCGSGS